MLAIANKFCILYYSLNIILSIDIALKNNFCKTKSETNLRHPADNTFDSHSGKTDRLSITI